MRTAIKALRNPVWGTIAVLILFGIAIYLGMPQTVIRPSAGGGGGGLTAAQSNLVYGSVQTNESRTLNFSGAIISGANSNYFPQDVAIGGPLWMTREGWNLQDSNSVVRMNVHALAGISFGGTNGVAAFTINKDGAATFAQTITGNGSGLTNTLLLKTLTSTNGFWTYTQNSDGTTNAAFTLTNLAGLSSSSGIAIWTQNVNVATSPTNVNFIVRSNLVQKTTNTNNKVDIEWDTIQGITTASSPSFSSVTATSGATNTFGPTIVTNNLNINGTLLASTNISAYTTTSNPTNQFTTGVLYTNVSQRSLLVGSAVLNGGVSGSANITLLYTNSGIGYQIPMQTGAGLATTDMFPFCAPLGSNSVFTFVSTMGTGATGSLTNVVQWQQ